MENEEVLRSSLELETPRAFARIIRSSGSCTHKSAMNPAIKSLPPF